MKRLAILFVFCAVPLLSGCKSREERELAMLEARLDALEIRINRKAAVYYVRERLTSEQKDICRKGLAAEGRKWLTDQFKLGIYVRNLLREGEFWMGLEGYDMYWKGILIDALEIQLPQQ